MNEAVAEECERIIAVDPGARGVAAYCQRTGRFRGELAAAARHLAGSPQRVLIATGFCVAELPQPVAETDGPSGALYLAAALAHLGHRVTLVTDRYGEPPLRAGLDAERFARLASPVDIFSVPIGPRAESAAWLDELLPVSDRPTPLTLVAIERVGPSHTSTSLAACGCMPDDAAEFERLVPADARDCPHNMRGRSLRDVTAPLHLLFEALPVARPAVRSIGIFDGGNEIGSGRLSWSELRAALGSELAGRICCRVPTTWAIPCGVSNWGGYALALLTLLAAGGIHRAVAWTSTAEQELLERLVARCGIVDGVSRLPTPTVDGLTAQDYAACLDQLRAAVGLRR